MWEWCQKFVTQGRAKETASSGDKTEDLLMITVIFSNYADQTRVMYEMSKLNFISWTTGLLDLIISTINKNDFIKALKIQTDNQVST